MEWKAEEAMEFKQLEMFVALADARNVQRAAEKVFRTQPAVSMAIARLEEEVAASLFIRRDRFRLTAAGEVLYGYAKKLLELRDDAASVLRSESVASGILISHETTPGARHNRERRR